MDILAALGSGFLLGLSAGIVPGPVLTLVITQTLRYGVREGLKIALSPLITDFPIILVSLLVLSRIADFDIFLGIISLVGGMYVLYLGFECFTMKSTDVSLDDEKPRSLKKGVTLNFLNPHPYLFWITIGSPLMLKYREGGGIVNAIAFVAVFYILLVGSKMLLAVLVGKSKRFLHSGWYVFIMRILGIILFLFSIILFRDAAGFLTIIPF